MKITLRDLAAPLFRRRLVLIITLLTAFSLAAPLCWLRLHKYESHMVIFLNPGHQGPLASQEINAEAELLKSRDLLEHVVVANGMQNPHSQGLRRWLSPPRPNGTDPVAFAARSLAAQIDVETRWKTNLIGVTYRSQDPDLAFGVLNSLSSLYLQRHAALHPVADSPGVESYRAALQDANAGLRAIGLSPAVSDPAEQPRTGEQAAQRGIENSQTQMAKPENPSLNDADLEREAKDDEQNYLLYLSRREQERTSEAPARTRTENVAIAVAPVKAAMPTHGPAAILLAAFVLAILTSFLFIFVTDYFDPSFHTPAQVIDTLGILVVIAVPKRTA